MHQTVHVQREKKTYCFAEYLIQDMPKEKKIEAFADYVLATYVDDTVLCSHHAYGLYYYYELLLTILWISSFNVCVFRQ